VDEKASDTDSLFGLVGTEYQGKVGSRYARGACLIINKAYWI